MSKGSKVKEGIKLYNRQEGDRAIDQR